MKKDKQPVGELIYGINPVVELLRARKRKVITLYTTQPVPKSWKDIEKVMPNYPIPIQYVAREVLTRMAETTDHQGVVAWVQTYGLRKKPFNPATHPLLVMLDGMQDPRNVGAIIRSAYCAGASGVVLIERNGVSINGTVCKASAGLVDHSDIMAFPSVSSATAELKKAGYTMYAGVFNGTNACDVDFSKEPACLIVGSEGNGVSEAALRESVKITLPQRSPAVSYNASVAAGILLFMMSRAKKLI